MACIVCFGVGLVVLLMSEVWLRFDVFQRWILISAVPACMDC